MSQSLLKFTFHLCMGVRTQSESIIKSKLPEALEEMSHQIVIGFGFVFDWDFRHEISLLIWLQKNINSYKKEWEWLLTVPSFYIVNT